MGFAKASGITLWAHTRGQCGCTPSPQRHLTQHLGDGHIRELSGLIRCGGAVQSTYESRGGEWSRGMLGALMPCFKCGEVSLRGGKQMSAPADSARYRYLCV